jgi:hypothetical protein
MNENQTLREQMWDLCYGLLSAEEVAALHKQIKSDPMAARLYAEVRLQVDLVASAAKVEDSSVTLSVPDEGRKVQPAAKKHSGPGESPFQPARSDRTGKRSIPTRSYRAANWLAGLAATALLALIGYGVISPSVQRGTSATDDLVVASVFSESDSLQSGLTQNFKLVARDRRGEPASAPFHYTVSIDNRVTLSEVAQTDGTGVALLSLPGSVIEPGAILEVQAQDDKRSEAWNEETMRQRDRTSGALAAESPKVVVPLAAKEEPVLSDVQLEKDSYQAGETVRFWVHSWRAFSNQPASPAEEWKLAMDGREFQPEALEVRPEAGIVSGEFLLPTDAPAGQYRLVGMNRKAGTWEDLEHIAVGLDEVATGAHGRRFRMANGRQMQLHRQMDALADPNSAEKGDGLPDLKSETAKKGAGELASRSGGGSASAPTLAPPPAGPAPARRSALPLAAASPKQDQATSGSGLSLKANSAGDQGELSLSKRASEKGFQDWADGKEKLAEPGGSVQVEGDVLAIAIPAEHAHKGLLAVVTMANVPVATKQYSRLTLDDVKKAADSKSPESSPATISPVPAQVSEPDHSPAEGSSVVAEQSVSTREKLNLPLPPEADGELDVMLYDQSVEPPKLVYRQLVQRESSRGLNIAVEQEAADHAPQQEVRIKLTATDNHGNVVPHTFFFTRIVKDDSRSLSFAPGAVGGFGGGGKGVPGKDADAKGGQNEEAEKKESFEKEALDRETKFKKALKGAAKPVELAAEPAPPSLAGPGGLGKLSGGIRATPSDEAKQRMAEDRAASDSREEMLAFSEERLAEQLVVPREVLLASNDSLIQDTVRAEEAATQSARIDFQQIVGRAVLVAAAAALLLFGLLAILHRPAQAKVWIPAMVVVAGSFAVGCVWLMNGKLARQKIADSGQEPFSSDRLLTRENFKQDSKPLASLLRSRSEPATDDMPFSFQKEGMEVLPRGEPRDQSGETQLGGIGPTVELPPNQLRRFAEGKLPANAPLPGGGGGFGGGTPGGGAKKEVALDKLSAGGSPGATPKAGEPEGKSNEPALPAPALRSEEGQPKLDDSRKKNDPDTEGKKRTSASGLLWQPNLQANEKGEAELNVQLPAEEGDYFLFVDVQGPNGVGTVQKRISIRVPPAAEPAAPAKP